jgi:hypothetical protein
MLAARRSILGAGSAGSLAPVIVTPPVITQGVPVNSAAPTVTGTAKQAQVLTCATNGTWNNEPTGYTYQWQTSANGTSGWSNLSGATSSTYTCQAGDVGNYLRVAVTASNASGNSAAANSTATAQVSATSSGIVVSTSTPAMAAAPGSGTTATSNTFSPPAGSVIVLAWSCYHACAISTVTDSLGTHLNWTKKIAESYGGDTDAEIWIADCPSAQTNMTVTVTLATAVSGDGGLVPIVLTGAKAVASQTGASLGTGAYSGLPSGALTTTAAASLVIAAVSSRGTGTVTPASGQTLTFGTQVLNLTQDSADQYCQTTTASTPASGTVVTISDTAPSGEYSMAVAEILAT